MVPNWSFVTSIAVNLKNGLERMSPMCITTGSHLLGTNTFRASVLDLKKPDIASG